MLLALLALGACERVTAPQAIEQVMQLERDAATGRALPSNFAEIFGALQRSGEAGRLRVIRDGREVEYWAFVIDRVYTPPFGNDPKYPDDRRSGEMVAWRPEDPNDSFFLRGAATRAEFVTYRVTWGRGGPPPRPWIVDGEYPREPWYASRGEGEVTWLQDSTGSCAGLIDVTTDRWPRKRFDPYHGDGLMPDDFGPDPKISCTRTRFVVSASAVLQRGIWGDAEGAGFKDVVGFEPGERHLEIPPQIVFGTRLVIECNGTMQSQEVGCGPKTWPDPPAYENGRPVRPSN